MKSIVVAAFFCAVITSEVYADTLIYDNSYYTGSGLIFGPGLNTEVFDYGSNTGGNVSQFMFRYYNIAGPTDTTKVRFYRNVDIPGYDPGDLIKEIIINDIPATEPSPVWYTHVLSPDERFDLPSGTFGYSFECSSSAMNIGIASGGAGQANELWKSIGGGDWEMFWWGPSYWAGICMQIYSGPPWEGDGTAESPYLIYDADDMQAIGADPNYLDKHFLMKANIDMGGFTGSQFNIIGNSSIKFTGVFDGNGFKIFNFTYDESSSSLGLFAYVAGALGEVKNVGLINVYVHGNSSVAALIGNLSGPALVSNCYVEGGTVSGSSVNIGGLVAVNSGGTIQDCHITANVAGYFSTVGGLVAENGGTIIGCYSTGYVNGQLSQTGGLVGLNNGSIKFCYATGNVDADGWFVGGLVGENSGSITSCYATGDCEGLSQVGGLCGSNESGGNINYSFATGWILSNQIDCGGLVGSNSGSLSNCYAWGDVGVMFSSVGGLVGSNLSTIDQCYSVGDIVYAQSGYGGLVGTGEPSSVTRSFWDTDTTGLPFSAGGLGRSTYNMQRRFHLEYFGEWDFFGETDNGTEDIWTILEGTNYPEFTWQNPLELGLAVDNVWMYQNVLSATLSNLTATVSITNDPLGNTSYTYEWEIILPDDVTMAPTITTGGGFNDPCCTFAAPSCNETGGISDSGQTFTIRVIVTGADFGNTGIAEAQFGIALLGDANNDGVVNVADRSIINAFWRLGAAGPYTFNDCNVNDDGAVNVADRSIANAVWRGVLGANSVTTPCPFR